MSEATTIGIVGVGRVGSALGERLARSGYRVRLGSREGTGLEDLVARCEGRAELVSLRDAAQSDVVFVAVPSPALRDAVGAMGDLAGRIVVDCTNPVGPGISLASPPEGSNAQAIAALAPGARVVKAFNTFGAEFHLDPRIAGTVVDVPIATDDEEARRVVSGIAERAGLRPLAVGGLANAVLCEAMAVMWIHLAMKGGQGRHVAWKLLARE